MTIPSSQGSNFHAGRFLTTLTLLAAGIPAVSQQGTPSPPLSADEVTRCVVQLNEQRANALASYSSLQSYRLEGHCLSQKTADMMILADYDASNKKLFEIVSESASDSVRSRVFTKPLEAQQDSMREENQQRSAITLQNYTFQLTDYQKNHGNEFYVLEARPLTRNKFLFGGHIWVDAKHFAIAKVEGGPAVNPSRWTGKTHFKRSYKHVGSFRPPESNDSETKVRILWHRSSDC